jgi:hypothetical protein
MVVRQPLLLTANDDAFDVKVNVTAAASRPGRRGAPRHHRAR